MSDSNKLREMINNADDQIDSINDSTAIIITQIEDLEDQKSAIENGVMEEANLDMSGYIEITKMNEKGGDYVIFGSNYNVTNITDWTIYKNPSIIVYQYEGIGWDDDQYIIDLQENWNFGYDYINKTFDVNGTYGINAKISQLNNALNIMINNKNKLEESKTKFENYAD